MSSKQFESHEHTVLLGVHDYGEVQKGSVGLYSTYNILAGWGPVGSAHGRKREDFGCFIGAATGDRADCLREQVDLYVQTI